jgi:hypothetical protein
MTNESLAACLAEIKDNSGRFYVYIMHRPDGRPFYVGKGKRWRIVSHEQDARAGRPGVRPSVIRKIWREKGSVYYRIDSFHVSEADAFTAEMQMIAKIGRRENGGPLVNNTDGGEGPSGFRQVITAEARAKISAALKGVRKTPEHVAAVGAALRGKKRTAEHSVKMSRILRSPEISAKIRAGREGFRHTEESKAKISSVKRGTTASAETRAKMSLAHKGKKRSEEARKRIAAGALKRPPVSEEQRELRRQRALAQPPKSDETKRKLSEKMKAVRAQKKWGVSDEQRRQISATLRAYNTSLKS